MMKKYGVFDIIGPVMIGPSSSHTAGACKLGKIARNILGEKPLDVVFYLHGSFAKTYKGHGTDRALLAGILGMNPDDSLLRDSLEIAKERGVKYSFVEKDLEDVHPNSVEIEMKTKKGEIVSVIGSSIGGGAVEIIRVNGENIKFSGNYPTLLVNQTDAPGVVAEVSKYLFDSNNNIAYMSLYRTQRGKEATMIFELDENINRETLKNMEKLNNVNYVRFIPLEKNTAINPAETKINI